MSQIIQSRLREARIKMGLTQVDVNKKVGINNKTLSGYENGVSEPDLATLLTLADLYNVTTDYLLGRTDNPIAYVKIAHTECGDAIVERTIPDELTPDEVEAVRRLIEKFDLGDEGK